MRVLLGLAATRLGRLYGPDKEPNDGGGEAVDGKKFQHTGRYYSLSHNLKDHCFPWWGMEWGYVAGDLTSSWKMLTVTNDYDYVQNNNGEPWVHCDELLGLGRTESMEAQTKEALLEVVDPEGEKDEQQEKKAERQDLLDHEREQLHECQQVRGTGPVEMCMLPAQLNLVYDIAALAALSMLWFCCCKGRRRALPQGGPAVVPLNCGGGYEGLLCGTRSPDQLRDFRDVGFCNCCFQCACCCWVGSAQGVWQCLRACGNCFECLLCFDLVWAETMAKASVLPAVHAYVIAVGLMILFFVVRFFSPLFSAVPLVVFAAVRMWARPKIREGEHGEVACADCLAHLCASELGCFCAIPQEAEYVELHPWYAGQGSDPWGYAEKW